uniref:Uncharacterized protein n=1 Tax=Cacopsylla melanoneura TaxID=428564 RepID=A0A8D8Z4I8_9HEMI
MVPKIKNTPNLSLLSSFFYTRVTRSSYFSDLYEEAPFAARFSLYSILHTNYFFVHAFKKNRKTLWKRNFLESLFESQKDLGSRVVLFMKFCTHQDIRSLFFSFEFIDGQSN